MGWDGMEAATGVGESRVEIPSPNLLHRPVQSATGPLGRTLLWGVWKAAEVGFLTRC